ncbi:MAG TPA: GldM family protein, partial [Chitinophagales bacterium]|nr:GldM family protein [Chitinophagales bacterium]
NQLKTWGIVAEQQPAEPESEILPQADTTALNMPVLPDEVNMPALPQWQILTPNGKPEFYAGGNNRFAIVTHQIPIKQVTPVVNGSAVTIETINAGKGLYELKTAHIGAADISLFYTNEQGIADILGSTVVNILPASSLAKSNYTDLLWNITAAQPDTLYANRFNPLLIAVNGLTYPDITPVISGAGNYIEAVDAAKGSYRAYIAANNEAVAVTISVRTVKQGNNMTIGSKTWAISGAPDMTETSALSPNSPILFTTAQPYVLYAGIANKVQLWTPNHLQNLNINTNNGAVTHLTAGVCTVTPANTGTLTLTAYSPANPQTPVAQQIFEVALTPNPTPVIGGITGGSIPAALVRQATLLQLQPVKGFEQIPFNVTGFEVYFYNAGKSLVKLPNTGGDFSDELRQVLQAAQVSDLLYITNLTAADMNGNRRTLPDVTYMVK